MRRLRSLLSACVIALSVLMTVAVPAAADPGKGSTVHPTLTVDPVPYETRDALLTITGKVLGSFTMELRNNGAGPLTFHAAGNFALPVTLNPGVNYLDLQGVDPSGRHVYWRYAIFYRTPPTHLTLHLTGPGLAPDGTSTTTVTAIARDAMENITYDYTGTVTFTSSNPTAVAVVTPTVQFVGGMARATLQAGTLAETAVITASAPGLTSAEVSLTPEVGVLLIADPNPLAADASARGTLTVKLAGVPGPLTVELTSSNPAAVRFESGVTATVTVTEGEAQVTLMGGFMVGTSWITGRILGEPAGGITIHPATVSTAIVGFPYQLSIDALPPARAGAAQQAVIRVRDVNGTQVSSAGPLVDVTLERIGPDGTVELLGTATTTYGKAVVPFTTPVAGTYTLRVSGRVQGMWDLIPSETNYTVY